MIGALRFELFPRYGLLQQTPSCHIHTSPCKLHNKHPLISTVFVWGHVDSWQVLFIRCVWGWWVFLFRSRCLCPCSSRAKHCPLAKWRAGPLGRQRRDHLFGSFSGCGCIICRDAICLRPAKPPMRQDGGGGGWMMGSETQPVLLRWQTGARAGGLRRRGRRWRAGMEAGLTAEAGSPEDTVYSTCLLLLIQRGGEGVMMVGILHDMGGKDGTEERVKPWHGEESSIWETEEENKEKQQKNTKSKGRRWSHSQRVGDKQREKVAGAGMCERRRQRIYICPLMGVC